MYEQNIILGLMGIGLMGWVLPNLHILRPKCYVRQLYPKGVTIVSEGVHV